MPVFRCRDESGRVITDISDYQCTFVGDYQLYVPQNNLTGWLSIPGVSPDTHFVTGYGVETDNRILLNSCKWYIGVGNGGISVQNIACINSNNDKGKPYELEDMRRHKMFYCKLYRFR